MSHTRSRLALLLPSPQRELSLLCLHSLSAVRKARLRARLQALRGETLARNNPFTPHFYTLNSSSEVSSITSTPGGGSKAWREDEISRQSLAMPRARRSEKVQDRHRPMAAGDGYHRQPWLWHRFHPQALTMTYTSCSMRCDSSLGCN